MIERYPLYWPDGWTRTRPEDRKRSRFTSGFVASRDKLIAEVRLLGDPEPIMSTNIPVKRDGFPYANTPEPADPGAAIYFNYNGEPSSLACDKWDKVKDNIHALMLSINALRGLERWGASEILNKAFTGFTALPGGTGDLWYLLLGVSPTARLDDVERAYRDLVKIHHPDAGGSQEKMARLNRAIQTARKVLG